MSEREWQPIATAPKDGSFILVFQDGRGVDAVHWSHGMFGGFTAPTHWMPLPKPPAPTDKEGG